jgi:hypothetical protein
MGVIDPLGGHQADLEVAQPGILFVYSLAIAWAVHHLAVSIEGAQRARDCCVECSYDDFARPALCYIC